MRLERARTQSTLVACLAFCGPGLFNALQGLGAAGSSDPTTTAVMNSALYIFFTIFGYLAGAFFNWWGPRILLATGGVSYAIYSVCVFFSEDRMWVALTGGMILGIGAAFFWTAQSAIMMAYPAADEHTHFIRDFWLIFNVGGVAGGLTTMGLNFHNDAGQASTWSYFLFTSVMLAAALGGPALLLRPESVVRSDGSPVVFKKASSVKAELLAAFCAFRDPFVAKMLLFFVGSNWFYTYEFSGYNAMLFNIRTRGLNSALFWAAQMLGAWFMSLICSSKRLNTLSKARAAFAFHCVCLVVAFGACAAVELTFDCGNGWDKGDGFCVPDHVAPLAYVERHTSKCHPGYLWIGGCSLDFTHPAYPGLAATFALMGLQDAVWQSLCLWLMATAAQYDTTRSVQYAACYKGTQSLGAAISWAIDLGAGVTYSVQLVISVTLAVVATVSAGFALVHVDNETNSWKSLSGSPLCPQSQSSLELEAEPSQTLGAKMLSVTTPVATFSRVTFEPTPDVKRPRRVSTISNDFFLVI